jgi:hypothetical protein
MKSPDSISSDESIHPLATAAKKLQDTCYDAFRGVSWYYRGITKLYEKVKGKTRTLA